MSDISGNLLLGEIVAIPTLGILRDLFFWPVLLEKSLQSETFSVLLVLPVVIL